MTDIRLAFLANGESIHTKRWLTYFVSRGYDVHLVTFTGKPIKSVKVHKLRYFRKLAYPLRVWNIRKAVRDINPDILHAHYISHYGVYGALAGFHPFIMSAWGSDVLIDPKSMIKKHAVKFAIKKADLITVNSKSLIPHLLNLGAAGKNVELIVYGVDLKMFRPGARNKRLKEKLQIPSSAPVVVSTRSLKPIYNLETLIMAASAVLRSNPEIYFIILGEGMLKRKLKLMAEQLKILKNVRFVGAVPHAKVAEFLRISDVYVSTSLSDATSVSLLEAMACGLPVIVTNLKENREWIQNGVNGFLFPKGDFKMLAEKVFHLLRKPDVRKTFGVINRKIVEKKGNYEKEMHKMEDLYKKLLKVYKE